MAIHDELLERVKCPLCGYMTQVDPAEERARQTAKTEHNMQFTPQQLEAQRKAEQENTKQLKSFISGLINFLREDEE